MLAGRTLKPHGMENLMPTDADIDAIYHDLLKEGWPKRKAHAEAIKRAGKKSTPKRKRKADAGVIPAPSTIKDIEEV